VELARASSLSAVDDRDREPTPEHVDMAAVDVFARIVCGVDGSEASLEAVRQSVRLGTPSSPLVLVAVSETRLAVHTGMGAPKVTEKIEADARGALDEAGTVAPDATTRLVHGRPEDMLLSAVEEASATLIAVGSHGHGRGAGIVIGSATTRMLHDAPCSVLVARAPEEPDSFPRSIVAAVDGSPQSLRAASVSASLGERVGVPVTFLCATGSRADFNEDRLGDSGLEVVFSDAKPIPALLDAAENADIVVVGSRGLRGLRALGSVSERVAHRANSSVVVVREPGQAVAS
jgi:nucleotide-binding universal stress UspA family protein